MPSGLKLSGGHIDANEIDIRSPSGHTIGEQQDSPNMMDNQFMNHMMNQSLVETDGRRVRDGEIDSDGVGSGDEQVDNIGGSRRKKRYHRHTQYQIQELENFFKNCPHPDDKQRKVLSRDLALEPLQVKFWFQNKRTQMKMQHERHDNTQLRTENERLRAENVRLRDTLGNVSCLTCGGPTATGDLSFDEHHLRMENIRLKDEIDRMTSLAAKCVGKPMPWVPQAGMADNGAGKEFTVPGQLVRQIVGPTLEVDKQMIAELACAAMEELLRMTQTVEPMWMPVVIDGNTNYVLNEDEYLQAFLRAPAPRRPGFRWEATRDSAILMINHANLIMILMNVSQWASLFCGIVAKAIPLELLASGAAGSYDGALQLVNVEFQMITPLVPTRETCMARFCKQLGDGTWAVVDVSIDGLNENPLMKFRKRPSGCLVQALPNGYSKITWIEHVEVEDKWVNGIYRPVIISGAAFGAKNWLSILNWQCERFASCIATELPPNDVNNFEGRRSMLKLAERMVISFCSKAGASSSNSWTTLSRSGHDEVKVMTHKSVNQLGRPCGVVISVATSIWLPATPKRVFDFFRDENIRAKWDILTKGAEMCRMAHITTGEQAGNGIILCRANGTPENPNSMLILQESFTYPTGSFVVYAPIDTAAMNKVLDGGDTNDVLLLPSGFAILHDGSGTGGALLALTFQILVDSTRDARISIADVATVNNLMSGTLDRIRSAFGVTCNGE